jgi:hypothetical protein
MPNGKTAPAGVYFYQVHYTDILGNASIVKGNLMLLH